MADNTYYGLCNDCTARPSCKDCKSGLAVMSCPNHQSRNSHTDYDSPYEGCSYDCTFHNGPNGCFRRKNDPELHDDFCVGAEVCACEWSGFGKCETCYNRDDKSYINCVYRGNW